MLNAMRDGAHSKIVKFILFGLLLLAAGGMAVMDVNGVFRNGIGVTRVATVGGQAIGNQEFDNMVQRVVQRQGMSARQAYQYGLIDQILQQDINNRLLTQGALKNNIYVGDDLIAAQIGQIIAPAMKDNPGATRAELLHRLLQNQGMNEQGLVTSMRTEMMNSLLQASLQAGASLASRQEAVDLYRVQNETRAVEGFILTNASVSDIKDPDDDVLKALYSAAKGSRYAIPETRSFTLGILTEDAVKDLISIPDEDVKKEYDRSASSFSKPEQRLIQQAVFPKEDEAQKAVAAVNGGKSLKDAAKEITGKDSAWIGENTYEKAGLPKEIADDAFSAAEGKVAGPVKTALGYHVMVIKKIIAPAEKSFDSVKEELRKELLQAKIAQQLQTTANTLDDRLASGEDFNKVAKEMSLKTDKIGPVNKEGATPDKHDAFKDYAKDRAYILKTAFEMNEGEASPVMQLSDGRYAVIRMDTVKPLSYKPYEEVRDDIRKGWMDEQRAAANHDRAIQVQQAIASGEKTLSAEAALQKVSVETFPTIKRTGEPPKNFGKDARDALFDAAVGETVYAPVPNGYLVATVKSSTLPDPKKIDDKDLKPILEATKKALGSEIMTTYLLHLREKEGVKINRNLLDMMYGPEAGGS